MGGLQYHKPCACRYPSRGQDLVSRAGDSHARALHFLSLVEPVFCFLGLVELVFCFLAERPFLRRPLVVVRSASPQMQQVTPVVLGSAGVGVLYHERE